MWYVWYRTELSGTSSRRYCWLRFRLQEPIQMLFTRPFLRWAGSKRRILATLVQCAPPEYRTYVEPFLGSGCLFFALRPSAAILGDLNAELMLTYGLVRRSPRRIATELGELSHSRRTYERMRSVDTSALDPLSRAVRFLYLNRLCFNGVYRTNRAGMFNVPMGSRLGALPTGDELSECSAD